MKLHTLIMGVLLATAMVVAPLQTAERTPAFGAVLLADKEMAGVGGGNPPTGMCASRRDCLDSSKTCQGSGSCAYKGGPGQEDYCANSSKTPPQFCALDTDQEANCGTWYRGGTCMDGTCQNAQNSYDVADANKRSSASDSCN